MSYYNQEKVNFPILGPDALAISDVSPPLVSWLFYNSVSMIIHTKAFYNVILRELATNQEKVNLSPDALAVADVSLPLSKLALLTVVFVLVHSRSYLPGGQ